MLIFPYLALQDDPELMGIVKIVDELTAQSSNTSIIQVLPFLRHVAPELTRYPQLSMFKTMYMCTCADNPRYALPMLPESC